MKTSAMLAFPDQVSACQSRYSVSVRKYTVNLYSSDSLLPPNGPDVVSLMSHMLCSHHTAQPKKNLQKAESLLICTCCRNLKQHFDLTTLTHVNSLSSVKILFEQNKNQICFFLLFLSLCCQEQILFQSGLSASIFKRSLFLCCCHS